MERDRRIKALFYVGLLILVGGAWLFGVVADAVSDGETRRFDERVLRAMRLEEDPATPIGPAWLHVAARDVTALGGIAVLVLVVGGVVGYLALIRRRKALLVLVVAVAGGLLLNLALKGLFARPRPDVVPALTHVGSSSFPSGHSMMSAIIYLTLGTLADHFEPKRRLRSYYVLLALATTFLVGLSRVYLGVHYPSDVIAGWAAGLAYAGAWWLILAWRVSSTGP